MATVVATAAASALSSANISLCVSTRSTSAVEDNTATVAGSAISHVVTCACNAAGAVPARGRFAAGGRRRNSGSLGISGSHVDGFGEGMKGSRKAMEPRAMMVEMAVKPGAVRSPTIEWREKRDLMLSKKVRSVTTSNAASMMADGFTLIDVRLADEYEAAHPEGAINVEIYRLIKEWTIWDAARRAAFAFFGIFKGTEENPEFVDQVRAKLVTKADITPENTGIIVACFQGGTLKPSTNFPEGKPSRSLIAACRLVQAGFKNVVHLEGGILGWYNDDMPVQEKD